MTHDIQELKRLAEAATAGNLDTVPNPSNEYGGKEDGFYECPMCQGEGTLDGVTYCNFDRVAMGVQFFGIGDEFQRYEAYFRAASPSTILALIEENERLGKALAEIARHDNTGITGPGRQQADSCVHIARAALKESTDV